MVFFFLGLSWADRSWCAAYGFAAAVVWFPMSLMTTPARPDESASAGIHVSSGGSDRCSSRVIRSDNHLTSRSDASIASSCSCLV